MTNDPFAVLGVSRSASEDEIKAAYRRLAKKYHPDLNPGDKAAEAKMREVNEAYTEALRIKKGGPASGDFSGQDYSSGYGSGYNSGYGSYNSRQYGSDNRQGSGSGYGNPFGDFGFGFDPFSSMFGGARQSAPFRQRRYADPELETVGNHMLAHRYNEAVSLLNRIPRHGADWHALYARADYELGNRISALDHACEAVRQAPGDPEYRDLLSMIESGQQEYRQSQAGGGYGFRSAVCSNPCLTCCAVNMLLNCCLGGWGRFGPCC